VRGVGVGVDVWVGGGRVRANYVCVCVCVCWGYVRIERVCLWDWGMCGLKFMCVVCYLKA
jgi:hypothetical protein